MTANLDYETGKAGFAFVGNRDRIWHGEGQQLGEDAPLDEWRIAAGLDWQAQEQPLFYRNTAGQMVPVEEKKALVRDDTQGLLGVVGSKYQTVQPDTVLQFYDDLLRKHDLRMSTAGSLREGRRIFASARLGDSFRLKGQDEMSGYLLLATSYDGTLSTSVRFTTVRAVCDNTLNIALRDDNRVISVPHSTTFNAEQVKLDLGLAINSYSAFQAQAETLADTPLTREEAVQYFMSVLDIDPDKVATSRTLKRVFELYEGQGLGATLRSARDTKWGAVNAVTEYVDHHRGRNLDTTRDQNLFGLGAKIKERAFDLALAA